MLTNFEEYTEDLTLEEKCQAQKLVKGFENHVGKDNAITNKQIREAMALRGEVIADPKMRKYVSYIRINYLPNLCATSKGYFLAETREELREYLESSWQRISQQHAAYEAGRAYMEAMR